MYKHIHSIPFEKMGKKSQRYLFSENYLFFTVPRHHQTYQNYAGSGQNTDTFLENEVLKNHKFSKHLVSYSNILQSP